MATIVEFRNAPRRTEPLPLSAGPLNAGGSADIVFFPGVRYERATEAKDEKPTRGKPPRDTLEIES